MHGKETKRIHFKGIKQPRRIHAEEKAKVVAAAWVTELIQFLAALAIFYQGNLKNSMNSYFCIYPSSMCLSQYFNSVATVLYTFISTLLLYCNIA